MFWTLAKAGIRTAAETLKMARGAATAVATFLEVKDEPLPPFLVVNDEPLPPMVDDMVSRSIYLCCKAEQDRRAAAAAAAAALEAEAKPAHVPEDDLDTPQVRDDKAIARHVSMSVEAVTPTVYLFNPVPARKDQNSYRGMWEFL